VALAIKPRRIGLISDTHGLLRAEAARALEGSELILHAGDVGKPEVLERLRAIAPVVAVRGNVDRGAWAEELPETAAVETAGGRVYILHDVKDLRIDPAREGYRSVLSGHSHVAGSEERGGVLYLNPGSAGPRRFRLPVTMAKLDALTWSVQAVLLES
jgi:putative phosphoesterase